MKVISLLPFFAKAKKAGEDINDVTGPFYFFFSFFLSPCRSEQRKEWEVWT